MKNTANRTVREELKKHSVPFWKLGEKLNCHEGTIYRMLRSELPQEKQNELIRIIQEINAEKE